MAKDKKGLNPADQHRKEERKKELQKNKKKQAEQKAHQDLLSNPQKIQEEITKLQKESDENRLDKGLKDKIRDLKLMYSVAEKRAKAEGRVEAIAEPQQPQQPQPRPVQQSPFYHPVFNPTGKQPLLLLVCGDRS